MHTATEERQLGGLTRPATCRFCSSREETLITRSAGGFVVPSWGSLVEGWLLVVPERHVNALAELSTSEWHEFSRLRGEAQDLVAGAYGETVMFEHGAAGANRLAGCGVDHAHSHVVPIAMDLRAEVAQVSHDVGTFHWSPSVGQPHPLMRSHDYLWASDQTGEWIATAPQIASQVMRRAIAAKLGLRTWDWKEDFRLDVVDKTARRLRLI